MTDKHRVPLVLISGLSSGPVAHLAERFRATGRGTAVVHYDLRNIGAGIVHRRLQAGPRDQLVTLELDHGCVSCTLRHDLLPLLRRLAATPAVERIVVRLDESMEPERVCWELHHVLVGDRPVVEDVDVEAVVTVVDAASWLADATGDDTLEERGLRGAPDDERTLAQVALAQVEFADVLVFAGSAPDAWTAAKTGAVLERVAPSVPLLELSGVDIAGLLAAVPEHARRGEPADPHGALLSGEPPLHADCGVSVLTFTAQRPFHPQRLHEAIDLLLDGVVRTRGRAWVASQPDVAFWVESAGGGLGIGHAGPWLDSTDGPAWEDVSAERRTLASLRWDPVWGDRAQELVIVTHLAEPGEIEAALRAALLTDAELAEGRQAWARYPDPFGSWHEEPCEDTDPAPDRFDVGAPSGKDDTP
ncbi:cobalamin biosynthesis protein CobW [Prauserella sp. PE36]|uniref:ribosome hibernation factor-recruiting GTPase MRF n=1 Tax=Prauserella sp. PE36 TaxID=1504709 RepID=UPI000DE4C2D6|nr:GTP-binding protein [Prauserella sp. PE36]RBM22593.1 cobalamin biosynthesis protein CobW [Prauserella sp. PE36]